MKKHPWKKWLYSSLLTSALVGMMGAAHAQTSYTVQRGDTLFLISERFGVTIDNLKKSNQLTSDEIWIGSTLSIPEKPASYTVKSGDVLWKIAQSYNTTIDAIVQLNKLSSTQLLVGQTLQIPQNQPHPSLESREYTVQSGDVLWKIAMNFGTTIEAIQKANNLTSHYIEIGQKLMIPKGSESEDSEIPSPVESEPQPQASSAWVEYQTYTVQQGETGWSISIKFGIPFSEFLQINHMTESSSLSIGQQVKIPVHHVPVKPTASPTSPELLDWWTEAQYVFPIGTIAKITDVATGQVWNVKRTIGAFHADSEPVTAKDAAIMKSVWGGNYSWAVRPVIIEVDGRRLAASASSMPHSIEYIAENNFDGHFDIHFLNSTRHKDSLIDPDHQAAIRIAAGIDKQ